MLWLVVFFAVLIWAVFEAGLFQKGLVNSGGFTLALQFLGAGLQPELGGEFIRLTLHATLTTLAGRLLALPLHQFVEVEVAERIVGIGVEHVVERVVERAQVGIDLLRQVAPRRRAARRARGPVRLRAPLR